MSYSPDPFEHLRRRANTFGLTLPELEALISQVAQSTMQDRESLLERLEFRRASLATSYADRPNSPLRVSFLTQPSSEEKEPGVFVALPTSDPPSAYTAATPVVSEWSLVAPAGGRTRTVLKAVCVLTVGPCLLWYSWRFSPLLALFAWWGLMAPLGMAVASLWTVAFKAANSTPLALSPQADVSQAIGIVRPTSRKSTSKTRSRRRNRSETWWDAYARYLRSRHWQQVRAQVIKRDEGRCQECGARGNEVHHVRYTAAHRKRNFKNQPLENLVLLCATCHRTRHDHEF